MDENKLFVVIIVFSVIVTGIGIYLFLLDKKITAVEKKTDEIKESVNQ